MRQVVNALDAQAFNRQGQGGHHQWRDQQLAQGAGEAHGGVADVGAQQEDASMSRVDEVEQAENDRQPDCDQEVDHPRPLSIWNR